MPSDGEIRDFLDRACDLARQAGMLQKVRLGGDFDIAFKGETDLVTEVDRACEELVVDALKKAYPGHGFLAEENSYQRGELPYKWIVDPLDGTTNYAHGFPWFCVSIALEYQGEIILGVIYHCMMDELFCALRGGGAQLNGKALRVSSRQPLRRALVATGFPYDLAPGNENNFANFVEMHLAARGVRRAGAAALDLAYVAAGRLDGFWECKLKPWDVAAGTLLVTEAGGRITNQDGEGYTVYDHRIVASNGAIHDEMLETLKRARLKGETGR